MSYSPEEHAVNSAIGGHTSWANTQDREARMAGPRSKSPAEILWHIERLDPSVADINNLTPDDIKRGKSARTAYLLRLGLKAKQAKATKKVAREAELEAIAEAAAQETLQDAAVDQAQR